MLRRAKNALRGIESYAAKRYLRRCGFELAREVRPQDTVIVGFPKSGHTWMQALVAGLKYGVDAGIADDELIQTLVPDLHQARLCQRFSPNVCFKSHHLPRPEYRRVIYLIRDGRDALVSYFHYRKALGYMGSFDQLIVERNKIYATWAEHIDRWHVNPYKAEVLYVKYEKLLESIVPTLSDVSSFLSLSLDEAEIQRVGQWCTFERMRRRESIKGWSSKVWPSDKHFIRRGKVGSHLDEMPLDVKEKFENIAGDTLHQLGYMSTLVN